MKRIRLAIILESLAAWDAQRRTSVVAAALPRDEFDVQFIAPQDHSFGELLRLANVEADVVHLADAWSARRVGPLLAARRRKSFVVTVDEFRREAPWLSRRVERFVYRQAAAVVAHDLDIAARRRAECGLSTDAPWTVVDDRSLQPVRVETSRAAICAELALPLNAKILGTLGPLTAERNVKDLIWVNALLRLLYDDVYVVIVGDGPQSAMLQRFAELMHVADRTRFVTHPEVFDRLAPHLTLYVDPARWSGPSSAIFSSQAAGVPVLAIDTPVRRRELLAGRSGFLVDEHDRAATTRHCHKLLGDEALRQSLGSAGRDFAASIQQAASTTAATWADVYRRAAAQS